MEPRHMRPRHYVQMLAPFALGALLVGLYLWSPDDASLETHPAGPRFQQGPTAFDGSWDLVSAIGEGNFAERAGLDVDVAPVAPLPDPIRVPFVRGTAMPDGETEALRAFADLLASRPDVALRVIGCSDPSGSASLNLRISRERAESVAAELRRLGVGEERFATVVGRGEDCEQPERAVRLVPVRAADAVAGNATAGDLGKS